MLWGDAGRCHIWASVRPRARLEAVQGGVPGLPQSRPGESSGNGERAGADRGRARTPTGTLWGLRPWARPPALSSRGYKTHPVSSPRPPSTSRGPRGRPRRGSAERRALRGAGASCLLAWKGRPGPGRPHPCGCKPVGHHGGSRSSSLSPGRRVQRRPSPPFSRGESAFSPSPYGHFLWPAQPRWPLCPGCQLERIT